MIKQPLKERPDIDNEREGRVNTPDAIEYMKENNETETEIKEIVFTGKRGGKIQLPYDKIKNLCNPHTMTVYIGRNGELYIYIGGGSGDYQYRAWFTLYNGKIIYEVFEDICW